MANCLLSIGLVILPAVAVPTCWIMPTGRPSSDVAGDFSVTWARQGRRPANAAVGSDTLDCLITVTDGPSDLLALPKVVIRSINAPHPIQPVLTPDRNFVCQPVRSARVASSCSPRPARTDHRTQP
jgi:hypothetical protein